MARPPEIGPPGERSGGRSPGSGQVVGAAETVGGAIEHHIGQIGVAVGCGVGIATAETGAGLVLADATCLTAARFEAVAERSGDATSSRPGVLYGCGIGIGAAIDDPFALLTAAGLRVGAVGVHAASERQAVRDSELCHPPRRR